MRYFLTVFLITGFLTVSAQAQKPTIGIKNFRQYLASLEVVTGIKAAKVSSIAKFYTENVTRLPKNGIVTEINGPTLMTYTALAGLFCKEHVRLMQTSNSSPIDLSDASHVNEVSEPKKIQVINGYSQLFLDRDANPNEIKNSLIFSQSLGSSPNTKMAIGFCTDFGASIEFISGE